jgi:hypothetical protein
MFSDSQGLKRVFGGLFLVSVLACVAAAGCSDIRPEPNDEGGGVLESPTHQQGTFHEEEQRQEEHR